MKSSTLSEPYKSLSSPANPRRSNITLVFLSAKFTEGFL